MKFACVHIDQFKWKASFTPNFCLNVTFSTSVDTKLEKNAACDNTYSRLLIFLTSLISYSFGTKLFWRQLNVLCQYISVEG